MQLNIQEAKWLVVIELGAVLFYQSRQHSNLQITEILQLLDIQKATIISMFSTLTSSIVF